MTLWQAAVFSRLGRHALVEFMASRFDRIAERLEQRAEERFAAAARNGRESYFER
jgi:hypothetical protein